MYLTLAAETGMLGFFGFFIFIYAVFRQASQAAIAFASAAKERLTLITLVAGLIGILVNMGAYELFYWPNQYILFCILIACIVGFSWSAKTKQKRV
jgi:hypothetical protein